MIIVGKTHFEPSFYSFFVTKRPISRSLATLERPKLLKKGSKWAHFTLLCTPSGPQSLLEKHDFDPFLTAFGLKTAHVGIRGFRDFPLANSQHHGIKTAEK